MLRKVTSLLTLCVALMLGSISASAYSYNVTNGTYSGISGGTLHASGNGISGYQTTVSLPFNFTFENTVYSTVNIHGNGYISFGSANSSATPLTSTSPTSGIVAAWGRALTGNSSGELRSDVSGATGSRVYTIQWSNVTRAPQNSSSDIYNFQIMLNEGSNRIDIRYGGMSVTAVVGAQIGFWGPVNGTLALASSYYVTPWTSPRVMFSGSSLESVAMQNWAPSSGLTYSFTRRVAQVTNNDAGIVALASPSSKFTANTAQTIQVTVRNWGANNLDSVVINWTVNGVARTPVRYYPQPAIAPGAQTTIQLGSETFAPNSFNTITATTSAPNGATDQVQGNDQLQAYLAPRVSGRINVAQSTNPSVFPSYREALRHVNVSGISGDLEIRGFTGTYNEQIVLWPVDATNNGVVTFTEAAGNDVVVSWTPALGSPAVTYNSYESARHIFTAANSTGNFGVRGLTFRIPDNSPSGGFVAALNNTLGGTPGSNITIADNTFNGPNNYLSMANVTGDFFGVECTNGGGNNITVRGNTMTNYLNGIFISSGSNHTIANNTIRDFRNGVRVDFGTNVNVAGNTLVASNSVSIGLGINIVRSNGTVAANKVAVNNQVTTNSQAQGIVVTPNNADLTLTNNFVAVGGSLISRGITATISSQTGGGNVRMYHNSVNVVGNAAAVNSQAVRLTSDIDFTSGRFDLVNNIFHNFGTGTNAGTAIWLDEVGQAINSTTRNPLRTSDFNDLMTTGTNVGFWDGVDVVRNAGSNPLATWRSTTGRDGNSVSVAVQFVGSDDLHLLAIQTPLYGASSLMSTVPTDIDGETRTRPYMGADEVKPTIRIVQQPESRYACVGENVTFVTVADITPGSTVTYQWQKDGVNLNGQTQAILSFSSIGFGASGVYTCNVKATDGVNTIEVKSNDASLIVVRTTEITVQPVSQPVTEGGTIDLMVAAEAVGGPANFVPTYQWKKRYWNASTSSYIDTNLRDNGRITGTSSNVLTIRNISAIDTMNVYVCEVQGYCGTAVSKAARLFIPIASASYNTPAVCDGGVIQIECAANPGSTSGLTVAYQWYRNGVALVDNNRIMGSTTKVLTINNATSADNAKYTCVTTYVGTTAQVPTEEIDVQVGSQPIVTAQPKGDTVCAGNGFTLTAAATGTNVRYQWLKGTTPIPSATSASYVVANSTTVDGGTYTVQVSNDCGNILSQTATVVVNSLAEISQQPASVSVGRGDEVRFSVVAVGAGQMTYQWYKGDNAIAGATQATYTITSAQPEDSGNYKCVVTSTCGTVTSDVATAVVGTTGVVEDVVANGYLLSIASPNPTADATAFTFAVPTPQQVRIVMTDMLGREVAQLFNGVANGGTQRVNISTADLSLVPGVYNYTISTAGFVASQQVVISK